MVVMSIGGGCGSEGYAFEVVGKVVVVDVIYVLCWW